MTDNEQEYDLPVINKDAIGEHRVISAETGVLADEVYYRDPDKSELVVVVKESILLRWDFTEEKFKTRLEDILYTDFTLEVKVGE